MMKNYLVIILGTISFLILILFTVRGVGLDSHKTKRFLYYYPNGLIANTGIDNLHMIGVNIYDEKIPPLNLKNRNKGELGADLFFSLKYKTIIDFTAYILISLLFLIASFWFLLKYADTYLFLFFIDISIFVYCDFILLAFDAYYLGFYFTFYMLGFLMIHLAFRLKGADISIRWLMPEIAFSLIVAYIGTSEKANPEIFVKLMNVGKAIILLGTFGSLSVLVYDIVKYQLERTARLKKLVLIFSISLIILLPFLSFNYNLFSQFPYIQYIIYFGFIIFPFIFIYGTYRYSFMPEQVYFGSTVIIISLSVTFIITYFLFLFFFSYLSEEFFNNNLALFNFIFLSFVMSFVLSYKHKLKEFMDYWTFERNQKLNQTLEEMTLLISSPISLRATVRLLVQKVNQALDIQKLVILVSSERFPSSELKKIEMVKISKDSEIWKYFENEKNVTITSSLMFGSGIRDTVYHFLRKLNIQLAFPMYGFDGRKTINSMFLVGERNTPRNFSLGELRFIKECTRLTDLLLFNYQLLIADVEKKRMEKSLREASILEETIHPSSIGILSIKSTDFAYLSLAAMSISGDYIDFIKISERKRMIFLGDVSGHGLGSGYLVSAIKALIHDQVESRIDLVKLFRNINNFLIERYAGNEFMTLIGGVYDEGTGIFEFINAGHLPPIIIRENGELETRKGDHRILGVIPSPYTTDQINLGTKDRLVLYSDGITETFNPSEEIFGEMRLKKFLRDNKSLPSQGIVEELRNVLGEFRMGGEVTDDMSLICLKRL